MPVLRASAMENSEIWPFLGKIWNEIQFGLENIEQHSQIVRVARYVCAFMKINFEILHIY